MRPFRASDDVQLVRLFHLSVMSKSKSILASVGAESIPGAPNYERWHDARHQGRVASQSLVVRSRMKSKNTDASVVRMRTCNRAHRCSRIARDDAR
jgi:hypothetical protein